MLNLGELQQIFERTRDAAGQFMGLLEPIITTAEDEHNRLYYHHIFEEEEQRVGRLNQLIPDLQAFQQDSALDGLSDRELSYLLSDLNLERFGLHNFREHLELALYHFQDESTRSLLEQIHGMTQNDYLTVKEYMTQISNQLSDEKSISIDDHDEGHAIHEVDHFKASSPAPTALPIVTSKKGLTVGSLRSISN